ncbi:hypothetical protein chiPu_0010708 [Chiloscyllium punctatum]|uniref:DUF4200 domain-containing protein n=1 Tax=Chiloscyllium punctatum TaxID=137246 RepID=A0A401SPC7_CHIPU|nr:hypothetical protein [Chiloscyllium punctatum]
MGTWGGCEFTRGKGDDKAAATMATGVITNLPSLTPTSGTVDTFPLLQKPYESEKQSRIYPFINPTTGIEFRANLQRQQKELLNAHTGPGYLKSTFASRRKSFSGSWRRFALEEQDEDKINKKPKSVCFVTDKSTDQSGLKQYIQQQRQLFLIQYTAGLKENSIKGLKEAALEQQQRMIEDEKKLAKNNLAIENLMAESQTKRVQAMLRAEETANDNRLAMEQIEKLTEEVQSLKSVIGKQQQELDYCITAKMFFEKLAPKEWKEKRKEKMIESDVRKEAIPLDSLTVTSTSEPQSRKASRPKTKSSRLSPKHSAAMQVTSWMEKGVESEPEETPMETKPDVSPVDQELYFKDPQEILDIFFDLEEQIVSLLQYCREAEEDIDRVNQKMAATQEAMRIKIFCLKSQVKHFEDAIENVQSATEDIKFQVKMFSWADSTGEDEKKVFQQLDQGLARLHQTCFKDSQVPEDTLQKLKNVEGEIHRLLDCIDAAATATTVSSILKRKQKEDADRLQEEMMSRIKSSMEARNKNRREAALRDIQKRLGRKLVYRSEPIRDKGKGNDVVNNEIEEVNEEEFFFT